MQGFSKEYRCSFIKIIHSNCILGMRSILTANESLSIGELLPENIEHAALLSANNILYDHTITPQIAKAIKSLWEDPTIQATYKRASEYQLIDSASFFIEKVDELQDENYTPTDQDILMARCRTSGITEVTFELSNVPWRMVDVGGQRNERNKWIHCFDGVTSVIYFVATSEYDLQLYEDNRVNRMHESLSIFKEVINCDWFENSSMILFLNKSDLFAKKIKEVDLKCCFDDYEGGCDYDAGMEFIQKKFNSAKKDKSKIIYPHVTCATDTENIRFVLNSVKETILIHNLKNSQLVF